MGILEITISVRKRLCGESTTSVAGKVIWRAFHHKQHMSMGKTDIITPSQCSTWTLNKVDCRKDSAYIHRMVIR
jgi:hypothetical protein